MVPAQIEARVQERGTAYTRGAVLAHRMTLREGPQALDAQRLGRAAEALHLALLRSNPPAPAEDAVIEPFAAWPKEWTARFKLAARGGFVVTGSADTIEIEATVGGECRLKNPWTGQLERFTMRRGEKRTVKRA